MGTLKQLVSSSQDSPSYHTWISLEGKRLLQLFLASAPSIPPTKVHPASPSLSLSLSLSLSASALLSHHSSLLSSHQARISQDAGQTQQKISQDNVQLRHDLLLPRTLPSPPRLVLPTDLPFLPHAAAEISREHAPRRVPTVHNALLAREDHGGFRTHQGPEERAAETTGVAPSTDRSAPPTLQAQERRRRRCG